MSIRLEMPLRWPAPCTLPTANRFWLKFCYYAQMNQRPPRKTYTFSLLFTRGLHLPDFLRVEVKQTAHIQSCVKTQAKGQNNMNKSVNSEGTMKKLSNWL